MTRFFSPFFLMTAFSCASFAATSGIYHPKTATLKNGLQVVVVENHLSPVVSMCLYYKVGTADDPVTQIGLSHFLEHLMFKGTRQVPAGEFKKRITQKGGSINAYTTYDITAYTCTIASEYLPMVLEIEADRMQNLVFEAAETEAEKKVVQEERRMRMDNNPLGNAYEVFLRAMYRYHPYGIPPIGYPHHIQAYTNESARQHYQRWYKPNNAILVLAGDVKMETVLPIIKKYFEHIPTGEIPPRDRVLEADSAGITQFLTVKNPRVSFTSMDWNFKAPNHSSHGKEHYYPLIVLAQILGGNEISRLYQHLVEEQKLCLEVDADYTTLSIDPMYFTLSATLNPHKKIDDLKQAMNWIIDDLLTKGVTEEELKAAKRDLLASFAFAKDGNGGAIKTFAALAYNFSVEEVENWPQAINAVTLEQVNQAIQWVFKKGPTVISVVSPEKDAHS